MDPYDFVAMHLPQKTIDLIDGFWVQFAQNEAGLNERFTRQGPGADPTVVMGALSDIAPDIMWEFGEAEIGHEVVITSEWRDDLRALVRAIKNRAPELRYFQVRDTRPAEPNHMIEQLIKSRFRSKFTLKTIAVDVSDTGHINVTCEGRGKTEALIDQAVALSTLALGEKDERAWLGFVEAKSTLIGRSLPVAEAAEAVRQGVEEAKRARPAQKYASTVLDDDREQYLFSYEGDQPQDNARGDIISYTTFDAHFGLNVLNERPFSSLRFSQFGEWFAGIALPPLPHEELSIDARNALETHIHDRLRSTKVGGLIGAGTGRENMYFDVALEDVVQGLSDLSALFHELARPDAVLSFHDDGLKGFRYPLLRSQ